MIWFVNVSLCRNKIFASQVKESHVFFTMIWFPLVPAALALGPTAKADMLARPVKSQAGKSVRGKWGRVMRTTPQLVVRKWRRLDARPRTFHPRRHAGVSKSLSEFAKCWTSECGNDVCQWTGSRMYEALNDLIIDQRSEQQKQMEMHLVWHT